MTKPNHTLRLFRNGRNFMVMVFLCLIQTSLNAQTKIAVYLFPGQGSDSMIFSRWEFDTSKYEVHHVQYHRPDSGTTLREYAGELKSQIDTDKPYVFIGVSLGGMLSIELTDMMSPDKTIIISSAKNRTELPSRYTFMNTVPLHKAISAKRYKKSAARTQGVVEPDRDNDAELFKGMLERKDPLFLKRATHMIVTWSRKETPFEVVHIHGTSDRTIPYRKIRATHTIHNGSHMMAHTRSTAVFDIVKTELESLMTND